MKIFLSKRYGAARGLVAGINTIGTRASDIGVTVLGSYLFTLGANPYVIGATIIAGNTRPGQFNVRPNRFRLPKVCAKTGSCNFGSF